MLKSPLSPSLVGNQPQPIPIDLEGLRDEADSTTHTKTSTTKPIVNTTNNTLPLQHDNHSETYRDQNSLHEGSADAIIHFPISTEHNHRRNYAALEKTPRMWWPIWLRRTVLIGFLFLYTALLTGLLLVKYFCDRYNGFFVARSTSHYTWTYGPTAVLVLVASLWRQVDYHCKILSPWTSMYKRPAPAQQSILLDLVSPLSIVAIVKAARLKHLAVVATIAGYGLLKLIVSLR